MRVRQIVKIMSQDVQDKFKKILSVILLILWCLLIFYFSSQNGDVSSSSSSHVIDFFNKLFSINLYEFKYSIIIVRKLAHMFLYFVLFLLSYNTSCNFKVKREYLYAFIFSLIYAITDEVHQLFIVERTFKIWDIVIDMFGSLIGVFVIKFINFLKLKWYN